MNFKQVSIKGFTSSILLSLGVVVILLSITTVVHFRDAAQEAQSQSLSRIIEVAVRQRYEEIAQYAKDLAGYTKQSTNFKSSSAKALANPGDQESKDALATLLNEQFHQRYVTSGIVDLAKIRIFDVDFGLVGQSNEGATDLPSALHPVLLNPAKARSGAERLKLMDATWLHSGKTYYSALLPLGGLRLSGYMEIVLRPVHNFKDVAKTLHLPLLIRSSNGKILYQSENWDSSLSEHSLAIPFTVLDSAGNPAVQIEALEDLSSLHESMFKTQMTVIGLFIGFIAISLLIVLRILGKHLFRPAQELLAAIGKCADGDLSIGIKRTGLKELYLLSDALATLVDRLRNQVQVIGEDSDQLSQAAQKLSAITDETSQTILTQRNETDQVATAINEMSATAMEVTNTAASAADSATQAREEAHKGQAIVTKTIDSISEVASEVEKAAEVIQKLQDESHNIGAVLDVIRGIAEQTNLLALNAAIEAARAGEQGRGFAVVADEVRTLASRTQESTQEIQTMIERLQGGSNNAVVVMEESKKKTNASVEQAAEAGQSLQTITAAVNDISDMNLQIAAAAQEESGVADLINQNISNITELADRTSDAANHLTGNSTELTDMAKHLKGLVGHFKI